VVILDVVRRHRRKLRAAGAASSASNGSIGETLAAKVGHAATLSADDSADKLVSLDQGAADMWWGDTACTCLCHGA
jgi:hypothetical protein